MTAADASAKTPKPQVLFQLPDPPERHPDEVTSYDQIHLPGNAHFLAQHLGNPETTLVAAERYVVLAPRLGRGAIRRSPDLFIAFGVDPQAYRDSNGYIISEQGKPPDFAIEVASPSTGRIDVGEKRDDYAALGITEYWRFDQTGEYHGARLAGDRLVDGQYQPIDIEELADGSLQGYSEALNLYLRWENGNLGWYDPATGQHILTFEGERSARIEAENRAEMAEARVRELEEQLQQRRNG